MEIKLPSTGHHRLDWALMLVIALILLYITI